MHYGSNQIQSVLLASVQQLMVGLSVSLRVCHSLCVCVSHVSQQNDRVMTSEHSPAHPAVTPTLALTVRGRHDRQRLQLWYCSQYEASRGAEIKGLLGRWECNCSTNSADSLLKGFQPTGLESSSSWKHTQYSTDKKPQCFSDDLQTYNTFNIDFPLGDTRVIGFYSAFSPFFSFVAHSFGC